MSNTELRGAIHVLQGLLTEAVSVINTIEPESTEEKAMLDALVDRMCAAATPFCQKPALAAQPATSMSRGEVKAWLAANGAGPDDSMPNSYEAVVDVFYKLVQRATQPAHVQFAMTDNNGNKLSFVNCTIAAQEKGQL
jgi:hypothetical protein